VGQEEEHAEVGQEEEHAEVAQDMAQVFAVK
jgi:hypothetical protein